MLFSFFFEIVLPSTSPEPEPSALFAPFRSSISPDHRVSCSGGDVTLSCLDARTFASLALRFLLGAAIRGGVTRGGGAGNAGDGRLDKPLLYNGDGDRDGEADGGGRAKEKGVYSRSSSVIVGGIGDVGSRSEIGSGLDSSKGGVTLRSLFEIGKGKSVLRVDLRSPLDLVVHGGQMY
jgi:hypothetical protein